MDNTQDRELSLGEKAVDLTFNPSGDEERVLLLPEAGRDVGVTDLSMGGVQQASKKATVVNSLVAIELNTRKRSVLARLKITARISRQSLHEKIHTADDDMRATFNTASM